MRTLPALLLLFATAVSSAKGPELPLHIPLETLGFEQPGRGALAAVGAMSTVAFLDEQHLLVTFAIHRLMKRLPEDPPEDQDRTIEAVVVHLPSGKVMARTEWRVHDAGQYLWNLGHGRFLLRIRDSLSTIEPLAHLASHEPRHEQSHELGHDPFEEQPFLTAQRLIAAIMLSPERDLMTVETVERPHPGSSGIYLSGESSSKGAQLNFYRLLQPEHPGDRLIVQPAGVARADEPVSLSLTAVGHLEIFEESHDHWVFDFDPYVGKYVELAALETTCRPHGVFVSASEFVAFGCRGGDDRLTFGGFNMGGEQMWQQVFPESYAFPGFAVAPAAGRFALSRDLTSAGMTSDFAPASITTEEIRVYQMHDGRQLLRVEASPVQRAGGNYDLSPNGLRLAVLRGDDLLVYPLPPLTAVDETAIRKEKALAPQATPGDVTLSFHGRRGVSADSAMKPQVTVPVAPANPQPTVVDVSGSGEQMPAAPPRKPPTLYTLPTDKPEERPQ